ncbi:hypothetical protein HWV62_33469 [Athelia sp. TMB]|nr:hypothetical protein HWV62_33469 [Athelia sp. TMB]
MVAGNFINGDYTVDSSSKRPATIRETCPEFRILVVGRCNTGKTTILKKVCNSVDGPDIFDSKSGKKITEKINPSQERGYHDIDCELRFKSSPQFVFHDSEGFESGSVTESVTVNEFLKKRAKADNLGGQLHAIWYCIPTDDDRPISSRESSFFNQIESEAPVIAVLSKFDGLRIKTLSELLDPLDEDDEDGRLSARRQARFKATEKLEKIVKKPLKAMKFPPCDFVVFEKMHLPTKAAAESCSELLQKTGDCITDDSLKRLLFSIQQVNVDLCIRDVLRRA